MNHNLHSPTQLTEFAREFDEEPETLFGKFVNRLTNVYNNSYNSVNDVLPGKSLALSAGGGIESVSYATSPITAGPEVSTVQPVVGGSARSSASPVVESSKSSVSGSLASEQASVEDSSGDKVNVLRNPTDHHNCSQLLFNFVYIVR